MKNFILLIALLYVSLSVNSQVVDTLYFDIDNKVCNQDEYYYSRVITQSAPTTYQVNDFYLSNVLKLKASAIVKKRYKYNSKDWVKIGQFEDSPLKFDGEWLGYYPSGKKEERRLYANGEIQFGLRYDVLSGDSVYFYAEKMPEFEGGELKLREFIGRNVIYPVGAQIRGVQGRVFVSFVVDANGHVVDCAIARGVDGELDQEAIRVVSSLPKWKPSEQDGKKVSFSYTVPINFQLQ